MKNPARSYLRAVRRLGFLFATAAVSLIIAWPPDRLAAAAGQGLPATDDPGREILEKFQSIFPDDEDLAVYGLDWAPTLKVAKARAAMEHRPIFLIFVTNSFGNIYTGHC